MPTILHLGHQPGDIGLPSSLLTTVAGRFDPTLDVNAIASSGAADKLFNWGVRFTPSSDLWIGFQMFRDATIFVSGGITYGDYCLFIDDDTKAIAGGVNLSRTSTTGYRLRAFVVQDGTRIYSDTIYELGYSFTQWIDINIKLTPTAVTVDFYVAGVLRSSATALVTAPVLSVSAVAMQFLHSINSTVAVTGFAHLAIIDGASTIGRRFVRHRPATEGYINEWGGSVTALGDGSAATGISAPGAGLHAAFGLTGPAITGGVAGVHVVVTGEASAALDQVTPFVRMSGTNHYGDVLTLPANRIAQRVASFPLNPETGLSWTSSDVATDFGLYSGDGTAL